MNDAEIIERLTAELKDALFVFMELERMQPGEFSDLVARIRSAILLVEDEHGVPTAQARTA
jgi:hypothetical protein